jgi:serine/threonine protein kinase
MAATDARLVALRDLLPGKVLRGTQGARYHLRERIGEGGQGWVFAATWNEPDGYRVVVKVLRPDVVTPEALSRFQREASVLRLLGQNARPNPHVVRYFDHAKDTLDHPSGGDPIEISFTVLEHVTGPTLDKVLTDQRGAPLALERARRIAGHVAMALADVHANSVVHRDLKPSNVLLATEGGVETAKVTDFGLVKVTTLGFGRTVALAGATLGYAPPEQFERGNDRVTPRTDVFSFAAMLYEMLTGAPAFPWSNGENPLVIVTRLLNGPRPSLVHTRGTLAPELAARPDLVERLDALIAQATAAEPDDRHATVGEFWGAVERVLRAAMERASSPPAPAIVRMPTPSPMSAAALQRAGDRAALDALGRTERESSSPPPGPADARLASPAAWYWRVRSPPAGAGAAVAAVLDASGEEAYACGGAGLLRWQSQAWTRLPSGPPELAGVRGLARLRQGEVLAFGARGYVARVLPGGSIEPWPVPDQAITFHAAHVDEGGTVTLVGDRLLRGQGATIGVVAQFAHGKLALLCDAPACTGLRGVTRLSSGTVVACGTWGSLVRLELGVAQLAGAICAGHLLAIAALPDGGALTVGAGGHALALSAQLVPQLEAVQTTRDLLSLAVDPGGVAWAGSAQARLLRRSGGSWVRMSGELGLSSAVVALWAGPRAVRAVCDDGAVVDGAVVAA